jgi:hypothetical protein
MNLNDVRIPLGERIKWMEDNEGTFTTPYVEIVDKGDCMSKTCKDSKMEGQPYWRVPALVNDLAAYVCKNCYDEWENSNDEYWLTKNIKLIENPKIF